MAKNDTIDRKNLVSKICTWKPRESQIIVEKDGKLFLCHFDKVFGYKEKLTPYKVFVIGKESYLKKYL